MTEHALFNLESFCIVLVALFFFFHGDGWRKLFGQATSLWRLVCFAGSFPPAGSRATQDDASEPVLGSDSAFVLWRERYSPRFEHVLSWNPWRLLEKVLLRLENKKKNVKFINAAVRYPHFVPFNATSLLSRDRSTSGSIKNSERATRYSTLCWRNTKRMAC